MEVECINDKDFPNQIPLHKHPKKGNMYTVIKVVKCNVQGGLLGYELEEIQLGPDELPYKYFSANRFGNTIPSNVLEEIEELVAV